ncbi:hypothetical protein OHS70_34125 [Streptomyces sp. NBC_00390]|uniref:hypothetical protein n=1 Tax=Streptomyces sp. NBC_00390 TaxID=2975736 RepID=UPI002E20ED0E
MYEIRPLTEDDWHPLLRLTQARGTWLRERDLRAPCSAEYLLGWLGKDNTGRFPMALTDSGEIVAAMALSLQPANRAWGEVTSVLYVEAAWSDPARRHDRSSKLLTLWLAHCAATIGRRWVGCAVPPGALADHLMNIRVGGQYTWNRLRATLDPHGNRLFLLRAAARRRPGLDHLISGAFQPEAKEHEMADPPAECAAAPATPA